MKMRKLHNRILSGALAVLMTFAGVFVPQQNVLAAEDYYLHFFDTANSKENVNTTIVEGTSINILAKLPPNYTISATTPFAVRKSGTDGDALSNFGITANTDKSYSLAAKPGSAGTGNGAQEYTLEAIYTSIIKEGTGSGSYTDLNDPTITNDYVLTVTTADSGIAMTEDSTITVVTATEESADGIISFEQIANATGAFAIYKGAKPNASNITSSGGNRSFKLAAPSNDPTNPKALNLTVAINGPKPIKKGTVLTIDFRRQTINSLIATVITEEKLLKETVESVVSNPTFPEATDGNVPYIKLEDGEKLDSIRSSFEVLAKFHRFNVDVELTWEWKAKVEAHKNHVQLKKGVNGKAIFDILQRPAEDMEGELLVKASYNGKTSTLVGSIPVTIYGSGTPATFTPVTTKKGVIGGDEVNPTTVIPPNMDVYDAKEYDPNHYTALPTHPYSFSSSLSFGAGHGIASYATITNESSGGEFKVFIDGNSSEYKPGEKIQNIGKSKSIEIVADKEGQCVLVVKFFNNLGEEMLKNRISKQIRIYDTSPKRDARLRALDLRLNAASGTGDQDLINNVYKNGILDYGFDKDKNVYSVTVPYKATSISLRPQIPPDTDADDKVVLIYDGIEQEVNAGSFQNTPVLLNVLVPKKIIVRVTSQAGTTNEYTLNVTRDDVSSDSLLQSLQVLRTNGDSGDLITAFNPEVKEYNISVPYNVKEVQINATSRSPWAEKIEFDPPTTVRFLFWTWSTNKYKLECNQDPDTGLDVSTLTTIKVTVTAEDGTTKTTYTLNITREAPSDNNNLASLSVTDKMGKPYAFKNNQKFDPKVREYFVEIPYNTQTVEINALHESDFAQKISLKAPETYNSKVTDKNGLKPKVPVNFRDVPTTQDKTNPDADRNTFTYELTVTAENGEISNPPYYITFVRKPASDDNLLSSLKIFDEKNKEIKFIDGQTFTPEIREYYINIPYSSKTINIEAVHRSGTAQKMTLTEPAVYGGNVNDVVLQDGDMRPTRFASLDVQQNMSSPDKDKNAFDYTLTVKAENADVTKPPYVIHVVRSDPDADTRLASLTVTDQDKKPVDTFAFNQEQLEYTIPVPYATTRVTLTPKAVSAGALVVMDDVQMTATRTSITFELISGRERTVKIEVTSESAETRVYTLKFTRGAPSSEARLSSLSVDTLPFTPKFNPSTLKYSITIPEGTKGYTVTPTAYSEYATITVNGKPVKSGEKSGTIRPIDPLTSTNIEVTAQDGKTKLVYVLRVRDENLIERSNNADLNSVSITNASLTPYFKAAIETYDVAISPETTSVEIKPKKADENSSIKVFDGTRELENYNGIYSTGIREDETTIEIEVTSQDKSKVKTYSFTIYKDNEEKQGIYKPITADMINWEQDPIYVDIKKYPVIAAEVFNTLKTTYPDKTMVFEGNDYSLTIKGKDIVTLVPNTDYFDLSISYNGPANDKIKTLINSLDSRNTTLVPVIVHFNHHGTLPGPMQLQLSLGGFYKNIRMYWNYYNEERNRIDYYGYFKTNTQGTFSVPLTHMSDYVITTGMVIGSENKVGYAGGGENIGGAIGSKPNPSTGGIKD